MDIQLLRNRLVGLTPDDLRRLRSIINGSLSRREITPEQQQRMQAGRKRLAPPPSSTTCFSSDCESDD